MFLHVDHEILLGGELVLEVFRAEDLRILPLSINRGNVV